MFEHRSWLWPLDQGSECPSQHWPKIVRDISGQVPPVESNSAELGRVGPMLLNFGRNRPPFAEVGTMPEKWRGGACLRPIIEHFLAAFGAILGSIFCDQHLFGERVPGQVLVHIFR